MKIRYYRSLTFDVEQVDRFETREETLTFSHERYDVVYVTLKSGREIRCDYPSIIHEIHACKRLIEALKTPLRMVETN